MRLESPFEETTQPASAGATLDLPVPLLPVPLHDPVPKLGELLGTQLLDLVFDGLDACKRTYSGTR